MTAGRGLQILGALLAFAGISSLTSPGEPLPGEQYYGSGAMLVIGLLVFAWGMRVHDRIR